MLPQVELGVFKVMFDRTRDWADIEAMLGAGRSRRRRHRRFVIGPPGSHSPSVRP